MSSDFDLWAIWSHSMGWLVGLSLRDYVVLLANFLLMVFARRILGFFYHGDSNTPAFLFKVRLFRAMNLLFFFIYAPYAFLDHDETEFGFGLIGLMADVYLGYLAIHISDYFVRDRFGKAREIEGQVHVVETYRTRLLTLVARVLIGTIVLVAVIRTLGFESWLEAGGVIGFIGVLLALTQNVWAPDIFSGLIVLNSGMVEEGDVIELVGAEPVLGVVYKTKMFHTEVLNLINNHRIMIRNSRLRDCVIHNLSKFASARGLREQLRFKIGYECEPAAVREMFSKACECALRDGAISIDWKHPPEVRMINAGDYAVEWAIFYYTKDVKKILQTRHWFQERILEASMTAGISLATPLLASMNAPVESIYD